MTTQEKTMEQTAGVSTAIEEERPPIRVPVVELADVRKHPNADRLDLVQIAGYECIAGKGQFAAGQWAVYIPEGSIVPEDVLDELGLWEADKGKGKCAGKLGNRVKAQRFRGIVSQGLLYPLDGQKMAGHSPGLHDDVASMLGGCTSTYRRSRRVWEGEVTSGVPYCIKYDITSLQSVPAAIEEGVPVVATENSTRYVYRHGGDPSLVGRGACPRSCTTTKANP